MTRFYFARSAYEVSFISFYHCRRCAGRSCSGRSTAASSPTGEREAAALVAESLDAAIPDDNDASGMTQLENLHFWLNSIHAQAPRMPIIVVGTKADQVDAESRERRIEEVEASFVGAAFELQLVRHDGRVVVAVDNTSEGDAGVRHVRQALLDVCTEICFIWK